MKCICSMVVLGSVGVVAWDPSEQDANNPFWTASGAYDDAKSLSDLRESFKGTSATAVQCWTPVMSTDVYLRPLQSSRNVILDKTVQWDRRGITSTMSGATLMTWGQPVFSPRPRDVHFNNQGLHVASVRLGHKTLSVDHYDVLDCDDEVAYRLEFLKPPFVVDDDQVAADLAVKVYNPDNMHLCTGYWEKQADNNDAFIFVKGAHGGPLMATVYTAGNWHQDETGAWGDRPAAEDGGVQPYTMRFESDDSGATVFQSPGNNVMDPSRRWILAVAAQMVAIREAEAVMDGGSTPAAYLAFVMTTWFCAALGLVGFAVLVNFYFELVYPRLPKRRKAELAFAANDILKYNSPGYGTAAVPLAYDGTALPAQSVHPKSNRKSGLTV
mmetsp:Transcript_36310/g.79289  ORF Transcript_36310/g.79289 Transcript_36310/m.79289 type:complete len:384 (+) Transcript_36310:89-1240(+)|eukprot:CAMPEP_0204267414 /NCGR_PEP_ID=MMETSP0468-20130131/10942_1 /ASSEMBLY_ACC=CAM_ASM_000383 /TAXON_ID=2969 /ORGANISM="Oxyrrhis marina" /LENGTH=383 /DNA_ID=CAMNT_0051242581 /DNA_START=89 /DNA_END=1240 /DNA_ORIENTATION=-